MVDVTQETAVTMDDVKKWFLLKQQLAEVKAAEAMLRSRIFKHFVPAPVEGTNTVPLNDGTGAELKAVHVINRDVDQGELEALREAMFAEGSNLPQLHLDQLVRWKPEVVMSEYRKLPDAERQVFERALIIKPGSPQMDIKIPKRPQ